MLLMPPPSITPGSMITPDPTEMFILVTKKSHTKRYARFCYLVVVGLQLLVATPLDP
jgi:hypothetical protein